MNNFSKIAEKVYGIIKGHGHKIRLYDTSGKEIADPADAVYFFVADPNFMVQIDQTTSSIRFHKSETVELKDIISMQKQIRQIAQNNIINFEFKEFGKEIVPKDYSYEAKRTEKTMESKLLEGFSRLTGSTKTSYQTLENVRLVFNHRTPVSEESRGSRSRNIRSIFIEHNGERAKFPINDLAGARAMARHISRGGVTHDVIGEHIVSICEKRNKLREFLRYAKSNKLINEGTQDIISVLYENIFAIRSDLQKLASAKAYESVCSRIEESETNVLAEDDLGELKDLFTVKRFDEKFEEVLPIVKTLVNEKDVYNRRIEEASVNTVYLDKTTVFTENLISFTDPAKAKANKLSMIATAMQENDELSSYMLKVSHKLAEGSDLTGFENSIVKNVLSNAVIREEKDEDEEELEEGYHVMPSMDRERYTPIEGLEGPFQLRTGKVVYYDPSEGKYYDRDTDMYMSDEEYFQHAEPGKLKEAMIFESAFEKYTPENIFLAEYENSDYQLADIDQAYWSTVAKGIGATLSHYEEDDYSREIEIILPNDIPVTINQEWVRSKDERSPVTHVSFGYGIEKNLGRVKMYADPHHVSKWLANAVKKYS